MGFKGTITFSSGKKGDYDIWSLDLEKGKILQLTSGKFWNDCPRWSPDGEKILFTSNRTGFQEIWVMDKNGANQRPVTRSRKLHLTPAWHPDGASIVCCADYNGNLDIYTMDLAGAHLTQITDYEGVDSTPRFSPDGAKIVFTSQRSGNDDIWEYSVERKEFLQLTSHPARDFSPVYSPDGAKIVFVSGRYLAAGDPNLDIFLMDSDGSNLKRVTINRGVDRHAAWSPDGRHLLYTAARFNSSAERMQVISVRRYDKEALAYERNALEKEIDSSPVSIFFIPALNKKGELPVLPLDEIFMGEGRMARSFAGRLYRKLVRKTYPSGYFGSERYPDWKF